MADIITLARIVGATSAEQVIRLAEQVFGDEILTERSKAVLADLDGPVLPIVTPGARWEPQDVALVQVYVNQFVSPGRKEPVRKRGAHE